MPTAADVSDVDALLDTSVAVALVVGGHEAHRRVLDELDGQSLGLAGHAWFETFSVLTRLPPPARRSPSDVLRLLRHNFPGSRFLPEAEAVDLTERLVSLGVAGGNVYDALVGAAAAHHDLPLVSRDHRAVPLYRRMNVDVRPIA